MAGLLLNTDLFQGAIGMDADRKALKARHLAVCVGVEVVECGERCLCGGLAAAAGRLAVELVQRRSGNGSALYGKERCRCSSRLTWCFVVGELTCSRALIWWFGVWCLVFLWPAGSRFTKASGRLAGMRGPATRLKRDVRPVLGVISDGRRVCVRDERQCVRRGKYCLAQAV